MGYSSIIDEFRQTAGRLALKHREQKAKHAPAKKPEPEPEAAEDPAEEATESDQEEQAEQDEDDDGMRQVFHRATRHARVVAHPGHGQKRPDGPPPPAPTVRAAAHAAGMPPKGPMLKPRITGPKR